MVNDTSPLIIIDDNEVSSENIDKRVKQDPNGNSEPDRDAGNEPVEMIRNKISKAPPAWMDDCYVYDCKVSYFSTDINIEDPIDLELHQSGWMTVMFMIVKYLVSRQTWI